MPPDTPPRPVPTLTDKLQELEQLMPGRRDHAGGSIPVLDELVEPGTEDAADLDELERRLQRRLDAELSDLAAVLKGVIKRCISDELNARSSTPEHDGD